MTALKIACIGEAMIEMIVDADRKTAALGVAGDSLNTAIYLRRGLQPQHLVAFVSMVGTDDLSNRIAEFVAEEGVSTEFLQRHPEKLPGIYSINTSNAGERSFAYWRDASAARLLFSTSGGPDYSILVGFDVVFLSAISLAILPQPVRDGLFDWMVRFRKRGGRVVFDSNYRSRLWPDGKTAQTEISRAWRHCDIALPSVDDEMELFGDADSQSILARLRGYGIRQGALKQGARGPVPIGAHDLAGQTFEPAKTVIDTTAAGDSFNGAFLASYLSDGNIARAMQAGHALASRVIAHRGAILKADETQSL